MGSRDEMALNSRFLVVRGIDVESLKECAAMMGSEVKDSFKEAYGNLLRLLQLEVQESAVMALSHFYDPDTRCFLFENFQLSPTLEEYEQILGFSKSGLGPYQYQKHQYSDQKFSMFAQVGESELGRHKKKRNRIVGFPLDYFEGLMRSHAQAGRWGPFKQLLALSIFGIVLFPQVERFVDEAAIGVFLAFINKESPINPIPAILADTFYSFTLHRVLKKKKIVCSLHVLYAWLLNHVILHEKKATDLLGYALGCEVEDRSDQEWVCALESLNAIKVRWFTHSCWNERPSVVFRCGDFPNVPLMGTQGCINYNPFLTIRQLGYPMRSAPTEDMLTPIFFEKGDPKNQGLLQEISKAWEVVVRKDKVEIAKRTGDVPFYQWLHQRIQNVRTPHQNSLTIEKETLEPHSPSLRELSEVKSALFKVEEEKKDLQDKLGRVMSEKRELENENKRRAEALEESSKKLKKEEESNQELKKYLRGAKDELKRSNAKMSETMDKAKEWRELFKESVQRERVAQKTLEEVKKESQSVVIELKDRIRCIRRDKGEIEDILGKYQQALRMEQGNSDELRRNLRHISDAYRRVREESQYWEHRFLELIGKIEGQEIIVELRAEIKQWKDKFSKLAWLANQAVRDTPKRLRKAEAEMLPYNTPVQVYEFVEYCRSLTEELMERAREAAEVGKKEKNEERMKAIGY